MRPIQQVIARAQAQGRIAGILLDNGEPDTTLQLGDYDIIARDAQALIGRMLLDAGLEAPPPPSPLSSETEPGAIPASIHRCPCGTPSMETFVMVVRRSMLSDSACP